MKDQQLTKLYKLTNQSNIISQMFLIKKITSFVKDVNVLSNSIIVKLWLYIDYFFTFIIHGASPNDFILCKMYKQGQYNRFSYLTMRRASKVEKWFNDKDYSYIFNEKNKFNEVFKDFVKRDWIFPKQSNVDAVKNFIKSHKIIIYKPINLSSGRNIKKINTKDILNIDSFINECIECNIILEECIKQSMLFTSLNSYSVNTLRVYTILDSKNNPHIISIGLRAGTTKSIVDNMHDNGIYYPVDIEHGIVKQSGMNINGDRFIFHPNTNIKMIGMQIPNFDRLCQFINDATKVIPQCRYIGWDVAVIEDGFEMIEGNVNPYIGDCQVYDNQGYYFKLRQYK